ncbi:MAG: T9SS type A sorting domain-containing protein [bacterium]
MKRLIILLACISISTFAQVSYDGPAQGSVTTGVIQTTDNFGVSFTPSPGRLKFFNNSGERRTYQKFNTVNALAPEGSNFILDPAFNLKKSLEDSIIVFRSMNGIPDMGTSIPPDPYIAVGPNHFIEVVNSIIQIRDKVGTILKTISADGWFGNALPGADPFDPKVIYDYYAGRWVMVWLNLNDQTNESYYLLSVSDDENPLGAWFNWVLPGNTNGDTPDAFWADYPGLGFDDKAIYICSDQFTYGSNVFQYERIRIINKNQIYINGNPGQVIWNDLWNIKYPGTNVHPYMIRPARMYSASDEYYFMVIEPSASGTLKNSFGLFKLSNSITNPVLDGVVIPVTAYNDPANPGQLGGGLGFKIWDSNLLCEPFYRDGIIHATHTIKNGDFCDVRYLAVNIANNSVVSDIAIGAPEYFYFYSAVAVNQNNDVLLTYSRSADTEYAGAFFTIVPSSTNQPLASKCIQTGKAHYVKTFGGGDNRWGDYMGAWVDPEDQNNFWIATEYAAATNTYGVWVAAIRPFPFDGVYATISDNNIDFGEIEIGSSETHNVIIKSYGKNGLVINGMGIINPAYSFEGISNFPITIPAYDSISFNVIFEPTVSGIVEDNLDIDCNLPEDVSLNISLSGEGYSITATQNDVFYASTASISNGVILAIDPANGSAEVIGASGKDLIGSITINPTNKQIYGLVPSANETAITRIDAESGRAFDKFLIQKNLTAIAFDSDGKLIASSCEGELLKINPESGEVQVISFNGLQYSAFAVHPTSGELWGALKSGGDKDEIHKINKSNGEHELVGKTGYNLFTEAMTFDKNGNLYGIITPALQQSKLISLNTLTAVGTEIGTTGYRGVKGLAVFNEAIVEVNEATVKTIFDFSLEQNYPNPFNPTTSIKYSIASVETPYMASLQHVTLKVYDVLGREVATLVNEKKAAGKYEIEFNASHLASGVYIVKLTAGELTQSKKILLMK